jgi:hypothetical protein
MRLRYIIALLLTVVLLFIARRTSMRHSVEITKDINEIKMIHNTTTEGFSEGAVVTLKSNQTDREVAVVRFADQPGGPYQEINMMPQSGVYKTNLPAKVRGSKQYYHIDVYKDNIKIASFPNSGDLIIKYKGHVTPIIIIGHILFMFATIFFGLMAVFTSIDLARGKGDVRRSVSFLLLTFISAVLGGLPFGIAVTYQTFGEGWGGWPIGHDITDSKTEFLILFWLITLILSWRGLTGRKMTVSDKTYSFLVILSFVVTFITFLIPHSI